MDRRVFLLGVVALAAWPASARTSEPAETGSKRYRGLLGSQSTKVRKQGNKTFLWASGPLDGPDAQWYDFTGSELPTKELQFGIGKDRIQAIDDPLYVPPDDPRLLKLATSPYRHDERVTTHDDLRVIGYLKGDEVRAYPVALLDRHELVNDRIGGKPVTVGG